MGRGHGVGRRGNRLDHRLGRCSQLVTGMNDSQNDKSGGAGWFLVLVACAISIIPVFGFAAWVLSMPMLLAAFILAIVSLSRGSGGLFLLLMSCFGAPIFILFAPFISTAIFGKATAAHSTAGSFPESVGEFAQRVRGNIPLTPKASRMPAASGKTSPPGAPVEDSPAVVESKRKLLEIYPEIGIAGTPMNVAYVAAVHRARVERPALFERGTWPLLIASELPLIPAQVSIPAPPAPRN